MSTDHKYVEEGNRLKHREALLYDLAQELKRRDKENAAARLKPGSWKAPMLTTDVVHIQARLVDADGEVLLDSYFSTILEYVVQDLSWNENGDWADAVHVTFS